MNPIFEPRESTIYEESIANAVAYWDEVMAFIERFR
jgi:hypothetical protein